eukprot:403363729
MKYQNQNNSSSFIAQPASTASFLQQTSHQQQQAMRKGNHRRTRSTMPEELNKILQVVQIPQNDQDQQRLIDMNNPNIGADFHGEEEQQNDGNKFNWNLMTDEIIKNNGHASKNPKPQFGNENVNTQSALSRGKLGKLSQNNKQSFHSHISNDIFNYSLDPVISEEDAQLECDLPTVQIVEYTTNQNFHEEGMHQRFSQELDDHNSHGNSPYQIQHSQLQNNYSSNLQNKAQKSNSMLYEYNQQNLYERKPYGMQAMIHRPLENNVIINHLKAQGSERLDDPTSLHFDLELHENIPETLNSNSDSRIYQADTNDHLKYINPQTSQNSRKTGASLNPAQKQNQMKVNTYEYSQGSNHSSNSQQNLIESESYMIALQQAKLYENSQYQQEVLLGSGSSQNTKTHYNKPKQNQNGQSQKQNLNGHPGQSSRQGQAEKNPFGAKVKNNNFMHQ